MKKKIKQELAKLNYNIDFKMYAVAKTTYTTITFEANWSPIEDVDNLSNSSYIANENDPIISTQILEIIVKNISKWIERLNLTFDEMMEAYQIFQDDILPV